jgi:iron complex outermembrane receptor protein
VNTRIFAVSSVLLLTVAQTSLAGPQSGDGAEVLDEVIVTSRRAEEKLNEVPIAITTFSAEELAKRNVTSLSDIAAYTAGLSFESYSGGTTPAPLIRGLTQNALTDRNQNVATFVEGVHIQQQGNIDFTLMDIERIEVLKGPQNAQYGRSAFAGAILWVPRKPKLEDWDANVGITFGSDERRDVRASVNIPLWRDKLAIRVSGATTEFDGTFKNNFPISTRGISTTVAGYNFKGTDGNVGGYDNEARQIALRFRPIDNFTVDLMYFRNEGIYEAGSSISIQPRGINVIPALGSSNPLNCSPRILVGINPMTPTNQLLCGEVKFDESQISWDPRSSGSMLHSDLTIGHIRWDVTDTFRADLTYGRGLYDALSYTSSAQSEVQVVGESFSGFPFNPVGNAEIGTLRPTMQWASNPLTDQEAKSFELRFSGKFGEVSWALGHYDSKVDDIGAFGLIGRRLPLSLDPTGQIDARTPNAPTGTNAFGLLSEFQDKVSSQFLTVTIPFADTWAVELEGRNTREKRRQQAFIVPPPPAQRFVRTRTFDDFTPRVNLRWRAREGFNTYLTYAKGQKAGGFNGVTADVASFEPEENDTFELGAKQTLLGGRVQLNYNVFYVDWSDLQLSVPDTVPTPPSTQDPNYIGNVKGAEAKGFEFEATAILTDRLRGNAAISYSDATFKSGVIDTTFGRLCETTATTPVCVFLPRNAAAGLPLGGSPIGGNQLPRAPKTQIALGLEYTMPVGQWSLALRGDVAYQDKYFVENLNLAYIPDRTLLNVNVALSDPDGKWNVALWGKNVTDEIYASSSFAISVINQYIPALGYGATFGLTANYNFGGTK